MSIIDKVIAAVTPPESERHGSRLAQRPERRRAREASGARSS